MIFFKGRGTAWKKWERIVRNSFASGKSTPVTYGGGTTLYKMTIPKGSSLSRLEGIVGTQGMGLYG